jgi:hypothetical protein
MLNFRIFIVKELIKLFPISKAVFERVAYSGPNQFSFTQVHQGQLAFINFLKTIISRVSIVKGYHTKNKRIKLFGGKNKLDLKARNKAEKSFNAHCIDSFSLASMGLISSSKIPRITTTRFISKHWLNRRELFKTDKNLQGRKREYFKYVKPNTPGSVFMRGYWVKRELCKGSKIKGYYVKPGFVIYFNKLGKPNVCYSQKYPSRFSRFNLHINDRANCTKHAQPQSYGGTIAKGASRSNVPRGRSKRCIFKNSRLVGYSNRFVSLVT